MAKKSSSLPQKGRRADLEQEDTREFRKANESIGLRVREGKLTLLTRKVLNVMMFHAQRLKVTGVDAPLTTPDAQKYFWVPLSIIAKDAVYNSKDIEFLKLQIEELQNIKLEMEDTQQWTSERLVASVTLVNPLGLHKNSGQTWLGFAFPPKVHELVMAPGSYTRFSLLYQGLLGSGSTLALYEICRRYLTNPSKVTMLKSIEWWHASVTGNPADPANPPVYKYFKRDVIRPGMASINALTDIQVELIEHKNGRKIDKIQFRVTPTKQPQLEFPEPPLIDTGLMDKVAALGFTPQEAADFVAKHGPPFVEAAVAVVNARLAQKNSPPLDSPAAYFRWALKQGTALIKGIPPSATPEQKNTAEEGAPSIMEKFHAYRAREALGLYEEFDEKEREQLLTRFKEQNSDKVVATKRGMGGGLMRTQFSQWYAKEVWGEPTAQDIADFIEKAGMGQFPED